ncbi:MAG TPA: amino acid ABC transporter permease [Thermomicrobiales bacterium]|jgi:His/Glu/Gln/Arg/opine family amino acid ABC transporter permease subunit|nr:amino acid ABC transporter permease [Thermomicrobiales bacterium]
MAFDWTIFWDALFSPAFASGAAITIALAAAAQAAAIVGGLGVALLRRSSLGPARFAGAAYVWLFRAIPTLLQLLFVWNALPQLIPRLRESWFSPFIASFVALTINESAYMAEIIRAGIASVDRGQTLAGKTLGLTDAQIFRLIVLPQTIRVIIPPTGNEFITLLKLTSLASVISLRELLTVTSQTVAVNFRFAELYSAATIWYLVIVSVFMVLQNQLERRFQWTSREATRHVEMPAAAALGTTNR